MLKKWDVILIAILMAVSFVPGIFLSKALYKNDKGIYADITVEGKLYKRIPLSNHRGKETLKVETKQGYNVIVIQDESILIQDADCRDKICIKNGVLSKPGQSAVCLPHKLMVEVKSTDGHTGIISTN